MSPRRRLHSDTAEVLQPPQSWWSRRGLTLLVSIATVVVIAAAAVSSFVLIQHEIHRHNAIRDVVILGTVRDFITQYTSPDPFHANDYADAVLSYGTGQFATLYQEKMNDIVIQVARAEPATGAVVGLGIQRWNDDGSADVVVAATTTTTLPDSQKIQRGTRWVVTVMKEGQQWKISNLLQVI